MRRVTIGVAIGFLMLVGGGGAFLKGSGYLPLWVCWLLGPLFWYVGFAVVMGFLLRYMFLAITPKTVEDDSEEQTETAGNNLLDRGMAAPAVRR